MHIETHIFTLNKILKYLSKKELYQFKTQLEKGMISPDKYYRVVHHFYNPLTGKGVWFFSNAKKRGIKAFNKAIKYYKKGNKKKAFLYLGISLHYLMDMSIPAHTIPIIHPFSTDDLENYLAHNIKSIKLKKPKIIDKNSIEDYFIDLANQSRKFETKNNNLFISIKLRIFKKKDKLSEKILNEQSINIIYLATSYCLGLTKKFYKEVN